MAMSDLNYVCWQESEFWLGYLSDFSEYWTQGETLDDLESHLEDLQRDLTSGDHSKLK